MKLKLPILHVCTLLCLSACVEESPDQAVEETPITAPAEAPFANGKADLPACKLDHKVLAGEGSVTYDLGASGCKSVWFEEGFVVDTNSRLDVSVTQTNGERYRGVFGLCTQRHEYTYSPGLNADHPTLKNWQFDELNHENESPCGWFIDAVVEGVRPLDPDDLPLTSFVPGAYSLGISLDKITSDLRITFKLVRGEGARCGDGKVEGTEQCDDGAQNPLDTCSASCEWNPSTYFNAISDDAHSTPEKAFSLEGFQDARLLQQLRKGRDADWYAYSAPVAGELTVIAGSSNKSVALSIVSKDDPTTILHTADLVECADSAQKSCTFALDAAGDYLISLTRTAEVGSAYDFQLLGTPFSPAAAN